MVVGSSTSRYAVVGLALALAVGAALRLVWPADMEYKGDERYSFERTQRVGAAEPWPWMGMSNSADVPHPGMSVWVFLGLAKLTGAGDPIGLNIACMALNVVALGLLVAFVGCVVPPGEREAWWWAVALVAVNPLAVLFHRKIWPPSMLPAVTVLLLWAWWFRERRGAAFAWGLLTAVASQIHPGAFFFTAGMAAWALVFDRNVRWRWTALGGVVGAIPAIPWMYHLLYVAERSASAKSQWWRIFEFKYWNYWLTEPFGLSLSYSLGADFPEFLRGPVLGGQPTYLVAVLHGVLMAMLVAVVGRWLGSILAPLSRLCGRGVGGEGSSSKQEPSPATPLPQSRERGAGMRSPTAFTVAAIGVGYGLVLTLTGLPVYRHYMIITFPVMFVALARAALRGYSLGTARRMLVGLTATQALVTLLFLTFVHNIDRPIRGDYGAPYRVQLQPTRVASGPQESP